MLDLKSDVNNNVTYWRIAKVPSAGEKFTPPPIKTTEFELKKRRTSQN